MDDNEILEIFTTYEQLKNQAAKGNIIFKTDSKYERIIAKSKNMRIIDLSLVRSDFEEKVAMVREELNDTFDFKQIDNFHNWAKTQQGKRVWRARPKNLTEIQDLVKACNKYEVKVRCVGSGHSWAPIFPDHESIFVYMDQLQTPEGQKKIRFVTKGDRKKVEIFAGATTGDFKQFQLEEGVNLPCNVILDDVQMVSVVATGCHGVGRDCLTPGDYVEEMSIVNSSGDIKIYKKDEKNLMKAVSANFGLFGIIYKMTITVEPQTIVEMTNMYLPVKEYFFTDKNVLKNLVNDNWSVEIFWFPYGSTNSSGDYDVMAEEVYARVGKVVKNDDNTPVEGKTFYEEQCMKDYLSATMQKITNKCIVKHPLWTPYLGCIAAGAIKKILYPAGSKIRQELPHAVHFRKYINMNPVFDLEFAFAFSDEKFEHVLNIISVVFDKMKRKQYPLNIAMEMRFMKFSTSYLCPAKIGDPDIGGTGRVFYIEILSAVDTVAWKQFSVDVADEWFKLGGIPHLAKEWPVTPNNYSNVRKVLQKPIQDFTKMLKESKADPKGIFLNAHLQELLYGDN